MKVSKPTCEQKQTVVTGILGFVFTLVIVQLWLLMATMNALLAQNDAMVWPAAIASTICLLLNCGLLFYLHGLER